MKNIIPDLKKLDKIQAEKKATENKDSNNKATSSNMI
jgi:hypothetical protein